MNKGNERKVLEEELVLEQQKKEQFEAHRRRKGAGSFLRTSARFFRTTPRKEKGGESK